MATAHLHLPHVHVPHVGQPQDQSHLEGTKPPRLGGIILGVGFVVALVAWGAALVALLSMGPARAGYVSGPVAAWTALAIASAISLFMMGIWKAHRA
ncbi:hypothetical protein SAMN06295964_2419 [Aeromicrobium choanae]|uniref:Uncharacterized protein n=2 Tax=Aeromicrobium choanae TaxID=1736691 RepID=A0A1T4Z4W1_9ACTN|nr:hypothetical protein SAMN06295964_2419 [Aeromicrobium choanae]